MADVNAILGIRVGSLYNKKTGWAWATIEFLIDWCSQTAADGYKLWIAPLGTFGATKAEALEGAAIALFSCRRCGAAN